MAPPPVVSRFPQGVDFQTNCRHKHSSALTDQAWRKSMATATRITEDRQAREREMNALYQRDPYSWARDQANALRRREFDAVDWDNVIGEIEDVARRYADSLISQYARIMEHFLKLQYRHPTETEPVAGWVRTVDNARAEIDILLHHNPGLKAHRDQLFKDAWSRARKTAINAFVHHATRALENEPALLREHKHLTREWIRVLPQQTPYTREQLETQFWIPKPIHLPQRPQSRHYPAP